MSLSLLLIFIAAIFIEVRINRGKITYCYVGFSIANVSDFYPHILVVRVFLIKPSMGVDVLLNVTSYTPNASTRGLLVLG